MAIVYLSDQAVVWVQISVDNIHGVQIGLTEMFMMIIP